MPHDSWYLEAVLDWSSHAMLLQVHCFSTTCFLCCEQGNTWRKKRPLASPMYNVILDLWFHTARAERSKERGGGEQYSPKQAFEKDKDLFHILGQES